jgi:type IV pilus assembly protein PilQ
MILLIKKLNNTGSLFVFLAILTVIIAGCASKQAASPQVLESELAGRSKLISDIITTENSDSYMIMIKGNRQLTYTSVKQNLPLGILFYFPDTDFSDMINATYSPESDIVSSIETSQITDKEKMSRIFISLIKDMPYEVIPNESGITISFSKPSEILASVAALEVKKEPGTTKKTEPTGMASASHLKSVFVVKFEDKIKIDIHADGSIKNYKTFTIDSPARIVFDLFNIKSPYKQQQVVPVNTKWVSKVRHFGYPDKVRLVLETKKSYFKSFSAYPSSQGLEIVIGQDTAKVAATVASYPPASVSVEEPELEVKTEVPAPTASITELAQQPVTSKPAWVNRIDFRSEAAGKSTIIIGTTRPIQYQLNKINDRLLQLKLFGTKLPKYRQRPLITTRFESAVDRITPIHRPAMKNMTLVAIELREAVPHSVEPENDLLMIHFEASAIPPKPLEQADLPPWKKVLAQTDIETTVEKPQPVAETPAAKAVEPTPPAKVEEKMVPVAKEITPPLVEPQKPIEAEAPRPVKLAEPMATAEIMAQRGTAPKYTGEKIALDFYETDIKNVFRILREISGKNFAIDKNVTGNVTMTLETPVPWDQVLHLVLKMNGLGISQEGDIIRIATLSTLTAEAKARQEKIAAEQKSRQVIESLEPLVTEYISVNYSDAKSEVLPHIQKLLTEKRGSISVDVRNNQLIVTDVAAKIKQMKEIVDKIDQVTPQVIIEARVVEVNTEFTHEIGIDWSATIGPDNFGNGTLSGDVAMNFPAGGAGSTLGFVFQQIAPNTPLLLDAQLNAIESRNEGKIISAPKIVTLDNKLAKIKQGIEFPYLERDASGNATVKFKNVDLLLEVTPTVTPDNRILMKIFITKNDIATITAGVPSLSTNEAQTELLVNDGDTIVIGGILKKTDQDSMTGWPGLNKIPLLGWLFKTEGKSQDSRELLIFITPQIVQLEQRNVL